MNFPVNQVDGEDGKPAVSDQALESETEDDVIHIDPPSAPPSRAQGGGFEPPSDDGDADEEDGAPILASDELAKNPPAEFMQPAVTPEIERRGSGDFSNDIPAHLRKNGKNGNKGYQSAPPSLSRFSSADEQERIGTPLENVQEYEPLFPDSDEERRKKQKGPVGKAKRPDVARHHFPSQDVWEDTPSSLQLETTVESPEPEKAAEDDSAKAGENADEDDGDKTETEGEDQSSFLADEAKRRPKKHLPAHLVGDASDRPGLAQRFPSQDIWEDAPAHVYQYTTVETPEPQEEQKADVPAKPIVPTRPQRSKPGVAEAKEVSPVEKKAPIVPERPKPQVPARPSKPAKRDVGDGAPLTQTISAGSTGSASDGASSTPKAKPAVPARPGGSKIAALKAGFMSDLNQKLGLGPQAPKPKEAEKEAEPEVVEVKAPLSDARKGRAKGPQRRKPAASPSPAAAAATSVSESKPVFTLSFAPTVTVFSISDDGALDVPTGTEIPLKSEVTKAVAPEPEVSEVAAPVPATSEDTSEAGQHDTKVTSPGGSTEEAAAPVDEKASEEADATVDKDAVEPASVTPPSKPAEEVPAESEPAESEPAESKPVAVAT